jgi:small subunit ribosomal protein S17
MTEEMNTTPGAAAATRNAGIYDAPTAAASAAPAPADNQKKVNRLILTGKVVSDKMNKTIVVEVEYLKKHRLYKKAIRRSARFKAHDETNTCKVGDVVRIEESRPISKDKHWRLLDIVQKGVQL